MQNIKVKVQIEIQKFQVHLKQKNKIEKVLKNQKLSNYKIPNRNQNLNLNQNQNYQKQHQLITYTYVV